LEFQTCRTFEVTILNNGSTDKTLEALEACSYESLNLTHLPASLNWQRTFEYAIQKGTHYLILGDDDFLHCKFVENFYKRLVVHGFPELILANAASYTYLDRVTGLRSICNYPRVDANKVNVSIENQYLLTLPNADSIHPSALVVDNAFAIRVQSYYSKSLYNSFFPDWRAHLILGANSTNSVFDSSLLVFIGGTGTNFYCKKLSKLKYFGMGERDNNYIIDRSPLCLSNGVEDIKYEDSSYLFPWCCRSLVETMYDIKEHQPTLQRELANKIKNESTVSASSLLTEEIAKNVLTCLFVCNDFDYKTFFSLSTKAIAKALFHFLPQLLIRVVPAQPQKILVYKLLFSIRSFLGGNGFAVNSQNIYFKVSPLQLICEVNGENS
jgi:glycosyltransferase involved in cell wall biosynthesis